MHGLLNQSSLLPWKQDKNFNTMKKLILRTTLFFGLILTYGLSIGQTTVENCPKKGTPDCPLIKNCPKKGTADCPLMKAKNETASAELANCPKKGTPDCPLIKNCAKKGTADCPYKNDAEETNTSSKSAANEESLPECCRKKK